jgi:hypothetical protein
MTYQGTTSQGAQLKDAELLLADVYHEFEAQPSLQMTDRGIIAGLGPRSIRCARVVKMNAVLQRTVLAPCRLKEHFQVNQSLANYH